MKLGTIGRKALRSNAEADEPQGLDATARPAYEVIDGDAEFREWCRAPEQRPVFGAWADAVTTKEAVVRGSAETVQVTTVSIAMTPAEAHELSDALADACEAIDDVYEAQAMQKRRPLELLIAALGMALANCPRSES